MEPGAFTKVSALGIEEQRVKVLVDLDNPPPEWQVMGDGYRVTLRVITQSVDRATVVPVGALFPVGDGGMAAVRAGAGLAEGVLIWGTTGVIVRTAQPARIGGVFFVLQTIAQALLGLLLANAIIPRWGWPGGFVALGLLALLPCLLAFVQPARLSPLAPPAVSGFRWSARTLQPLAVVFLQLAALGAFWAYLEPLGQAVGLNAQAAQSLVAAVLVMQVIGGSVAALAVRRLPLVPALVFCSVALAAVTATIHQLPAGGVRTFSIACAVFGFVWLESLSVFYAYAVVYGFGYAGVMTGVLTTVRALAPAQRRGSAMGIIGMFGWFGHAIGGYLGGLLHDITGAHGAAYAVAAVAGLLNLIIVSTLLPRARRPDLAVA